jgi:hypothetical protein
MCKHSVMLLCSTTSNMKSWIYLLCVTFVVFCGKNSWAGKQGGFYDHHRIALPNHFTLPCSMLPCYHCITQYISRRFDKAPFCNMTRGMYVRARKSDRRLATSFPTLSAKDEDGGREKVREEDVSRSKKTNRIIFHNLALPVSFDEVHGLKEGLEGFCCWSSSFFWSSHARGLGMYLDKEACLVN